MAKKSIVIAMSCLFALCLALVGCGSSDNGQAAAKAAFTGTWDLVELAEGEDVTTSEDLDSLRALGLDIFTNLDEDGTAALVLFGESIVGTWEASSTTEGTVVLSDQTLSMSIQNSKLVFEQGTSKLTFVKGEHKDTPPSSSSSSSASQSTSSSESTSSSSSSQ